MALTLAQRTQLRKSAAKEAAAQAPATSMAGATAYELQLAQLAQHRHRLKQIQSTEGKIELKRQLLPEYTPYMDGVLAGGRGAQDEVLTTLMLWHLDVGDFNTGLTLAAYVLKHGLVMPDRFERTTGCLIAEEVAEAALKALKVDQGFSLQTLERAAELTREKDMPDQVRAKLHLATGRVLAGQVADDAPIRGAMNALRVMTGRVPDAAPSPEQLASLASARTHLLRAIELHSNCGGKKDLERVERLLKKHADQAPPAS